MPFAIEDEMSASEYSLVARIPDVQTYLALRRGVGLLTFSEEAAALGLAGTIHCVSVIHRDEIVGMGRIIGDGGCIFQVVDIVVQREHQGHGLGKRIMTALAAYIHEALPASAYVSLIADVPANKLYEQFGFQETAPRSIGMALIL